MVYTLSIPLCEWLPSAAASWASVRCAKLTRGDRPPPAKCARGFHGGQARGSGGSRAILADGAVSAAADPAFSDHEVARLSNWFFERRGVGRLLPEHRS